jgi:hypothetical protein
MLYTRASTIRRPSVMIEPYTQLSPSLDAARRESRNRRPTAGAIVAADPKPGQVVSTWALGQAFSASSRRRRPCGAGRSMRSSAPASPVARRRGSVERNGLADRIEITRETSKTSISREGRRVDVQVDAGRPSASGKGSMLAPHGGARSRCQSDPRREITPRAGHGPRPGVDARFFDDDLGHWRKETRRMARST